MGRSVPTLLGIIILLLVALLVIGIYNLKVSNEVAAGGTVTGIKAQELITGEEAPTTLPAPPAPAGQ